LHQSNPDGDASKCLKEAWRQKEKKRKNISDKKKSSKGGVSKLPLGKETKKRNFYFSICSLGYGVEGKQMYVVKERGQYF
jgi:hypothetical protein